MSEWKLSLCQQNGQACVTDNDTLDPVQPRKVACFTRNGQQHPLAHVIIRRKIVINENKKCGNTSAAVCMTLFQPRLVNKDPDRFSFPVRGLNLQQLRVNNGLACWSRADRSTNHLYEQMYLLLFLKLMPLNCSSFIQSLGILDYIDLRNTNRISVLKFVIIKIPAHRRLVQLSLFHPLGAMSHRVSEGGLKHDNQNILESLKENLALVHRARVQTKVLVLRSVSRQNHHQFSVPLFQCSLQLILNVLTDRLVQP